MVVLARVSASSCALTNWLGNNALSALSNIARSFTVPVVVSIWLSTVASVPVASCVVLLRSNAVTGRVAPAASRFITCGTIVLGQRENDGNRLQLGNHHQPVGVGCLHVIARVHLAQTHPPGDRGT